jgi:anti-sigma factor RsiW
MSARDRHPDVLAFVAGHLPDARNPEVVAHLRECEECREEERSLRSLRQSLRTAPVEAHPSVEKLVALEEAGEKGESAPVEDGATPDQRALAGHLAGCPECRSDLEALARARHHRAVPGSAADAADEARPRAGSPVSRRAGTWRIDRRLVGVAAGLAAAVIVGAVLLRVRPGADPTALPQGLILYPPTRAGSVSPSIPAGAPATLRVVLPFGAPGGRFKAALRCDPREVPGTLETKVVKNGEMIEVRLQAPAQPARCELVVIPVDDRASEAFLYPLQVVPGLPEQRPPR